jgi:hypothetical protein
MSDMKCIVRLHLIVYFYRDFFERESGEKCTIVFHRDDEAGEQLFVALKFETKEAARDILDR